MGIDAINGFLAAEAWTEASKLSASDLITSYKELHIKSIIYTDINKDGMLSGPNLLETSEVAILSPFPVIGSCGVKDINDLTNLSKIPRHKSSAGRRSKRSGNSRFNLFIWP